MDLNKSECSSSSLYYFFWGYFHFEGDVGYKVSMQKSEEYFTRWNNNRYTYNL